MTEKKPQDPPSTEAVSSVLDKPAMANNKEKSEKLDTTTVPVEAPAVLPPAHIATLPAFSKSQPNDLYRRLLPAVLFLLTFVTVMTMLLIYMDTVTLGAQQFRLNMTRDYELRIPQDKPEFVAYVRQLHLTTKDDGLQPIPTDRVDVIDRVFPKDYTGVIIDISGEGPRDPTAWYLSSVRGWRSAGVRASTTDFLQMSGTALHAGLASTLYPREVTYHAPHTSQSEASSGRFSSRVLSLPLYTVLLALDGRTADFLLLRSHQTPAALGYLPPHGTNIKLIEFRSTDPQALNATTSELQSRNYTIFHTFDDGIMYKLNNFTLV